MAASGRSLVYCEPQQPAAGEARSGSDRVALGYRYMLSVKAVLFVTLGLFAAVFIAVWAASVRRVRRVAGQPGPQAEGEEGERHDPAPALGLIGFVVNFFDTLGIGSFATTTSIFKLRRLVPDRLIPGTLNVGLALPTFVQALIYISIVEVDMRTLVLMIAAAVAGAWLGAGVVAGWPRRNIQIGMGIALLLAAVLMLGTQLSWFPLGGDALGVLACAWRSRWPATSPSER